MPTEKKREQVADLAELMRQCTIAISTDFRGLRVTEMTSLRRHLEERSLTYRVVKNRLAALAAKEAGREELAQLLQESTGLTLGYGDPLEAIKALDEHVRATRLRLVVRSAVMDGQLLSGAQITTLASLPSKEVLLARLMAQFQGPLYRLVNILNSPLQGLAYLLQRRAEQIAS